MKKIPLIIVLLFTGLLISSLSSCNIKCAKGSGKEAAEDRKVSGFNKLSVSGGFKIILKQDSSFTLHITADDNLLRYVKTEVSGSRLRIFTRKNICTIQPMIVTVGIGNLNEFKATGAVEAESNGNIKTQDLNLKLSGATKITLDLNAANVTTEGSGSVELFLKGQASSHNIDMSGSGKLHALDFVVGSCNITTSGVGESEVNVLNSLSVHSSGASTVRYKGNPSSVTNDKSGASSLEKIN